MIFVTVGTQLPFDRLIKTVDELAPLFPGTRFIAQVFRGSYQPENIETVEFITPLQFNDYILSAELVISHAGIGTITSVAEMQKPLIVFPRQYKLKEHRNDHQLATCKMLGKEYHLNIAYDQDQLRRFITEFRDGRLRGTPKIATGASSGLVNSIRGFIAAGR